MIRFEFFDRPRSEPSVLQGATSPASTLSAGARAASAPSILQRPAQQPPAPAGSRPANRETRFAHHLGAATDATHNVPAKITGRIDDVTPATSHEADELQERRGWLTQRIVQWQAEIDTGSISAATQLEPDIDPPRSRASGSWLRRHTALWQTDQTSGAAAQRKPAIDPPLLRDWRASQIRQVNHQIAAIDKRLSELRGHANEPPRSGN